MKWIVQLMCLMLVLWSAPAMALEEFAEATLQNAVTATGNGTAVVVNRYNTIALQVTISASATVTFEGTVDGTTYISVPCSDMSSAAGTSATTATATGTYRCSMVGLYGFRARVSTYSSGTVTVYARSTTAGGNGGGAGSNSTAMGTATANAPTYTEGGSYPISIDLNGNVRFTMGTYLAYEDGTNLLARVSGGKVRSTTLATAVTTNTTSTVAELPTGEKTIYGSVTGTGAVTQTQAIYGGISSSFTPTTDGILLCTLTLSGTTTAVDACPPFTAPYPYYKVVTTNTTGTDASGIVTGLY
jgi:hypothetical protein